MKRHINKQTTTILYVLLFSIGLLTTLNTDAARGGEAGARIAADKQLQRQITRIKKIDRELTRKIDAIPGAQIYANGETLPDGSIVFWVDDTGHHGLAAWPHDEGDLLNWFEAVEAAEAHGPGWRLPTKKEQRKMYNNLHKHVPPLGGFSNYRDPLSLPDEPGTPYWSGTKDDNVSSWFMYFNQTNSFQFTHNRKIKKLARAVKEF